MLAATLNFTVTSLSRVPLKFSRIDDAFVGSDKGCT